MRPRRTLTALLILAIATGVSHAEVIEEIVAKINNRIITKSEFEERGKAVLRQIYQQYYGEELDRELREAEDGLLANLITENLLLERATTVFDLSKIRSNLVEDFRKQQEIGSEEELLRLLSEQGMTRTDLEDQLIRLAVPQEIINYDVRRKISVSEAEIRKYYDDHMTDWESPATVTLREIVVLYDPAGRTAAELRVEAALRELNEGADFLDLVERYSEAGTREDGGLLGPVRASDLNPALAGTVFELEPGEVSDAIDTGRSFHVCRLEEKTPKITKTLDEVHDTIIGSVRQEKFKPRYDSYLKRLWRQNQIEVMPKYEQFLVASPLKPKTDG